MIRFKSFIMQISNTNQCVLHLSETCSHTEKYTLLKSRYINMMLMYQETHRTFKGQPNHLGEVSYIQ